VIRGNANDLDVSRYLALFPYPYRLKKTNAKEFISFEKKTGIILITLGIILKQQENLSA